MALGMGIDGRALWALVFIAALAFVMAAATASEDAEGQENKDITLYLHNVTNSVPIGNVATLRIMDTEQGVGPLTTTTPTINSVKTEFYLYPALANNVTVEGQITVYMWAIRTVRMGDADQATLIWELYDVDETGAKVAKVSRGLRTLSMIIDWKQYWVTNDTVSKYTVAKGHYLLLEFELQGSSSNDYQVAWGDSNYRSKVVIGSLDYVLVEHVEARDDTGIPRIAFDYDAEVKDVTFHADVTDPFGGYDVQHVNVTLEGPAGGLVLVDSGMTMTSGYFTSWRSGYQLDWNYDGYPAGMYNLTVSAVDNSGWYFRYPSHPENETYGGHLETLTVVFWIGGPPQEVTVEVRDNLTLPLEGALVTIYETSNSTDASGVSVLLVSNGTFPLTVRWQGVLVLETDLTVDGATLANLTVAVYHPTFIAVDDLGDPLEDAVALVEHPNGTVLSTYGRTDVTGSFGLARMPGGEYGITLLWLGSPVHEGRLVIDGNGPYTLTCWVYTLDIRVEDDEGTGLDLAQVVALNSTSHLVMDSRLTDIQGDLSVRLPLGSYDMAVYWRGRLVHDATRDLLVNASADLTLLADIFRLDVSVTDSGGLPLTGAKVVIADADGGTVLDFCITDGDGVMATRLALGAYSVSVFWSDVLVHLESRLEVTDHDQITIVADVHWVTFTVEDAGGEALPAAGLALVHSAGQSFGALLTDEDGNATFRLPSGAYGATATWLGVVVFDDDLQVSSIDTIAVPTSVHRVSFHVVDALVGDLPGALVNVQVVASGQSAGTGTTGEDGTTIIRLPEGQVATSVTWLDSPVHEGQVTVDGAGPYQLVASVHLVTFTMMDSEDVGLASALLDLVNLATDRSFGTSIADQNGEAVLRLPAGDYLTRVTWKEHLVLDVNTAISSNVPVVLECAVFHPTVLLVDSRDLPLEGAHTVVTSEADGDGMGALPTGPDGTVSFRLPEGAYAVSASWSGVRVLEDVITVVDGSVHKLTASVHYPDILLADSRDVPLANARVTVALRDSGAVMASGITDGNGSVVLRLPAADYMTEVVWGDELCLVAPVEVEDDGPVHLSAWVHYLDISVNDGEGVALAGCVAVVTNATTGVAVGRGATSPDGDLELRLPRGTFALEVAWMGITVHVDNELEVSGDDAHAINATVHYLTVKVVGSDGSPVDKATISAMMGERTLAAGETGSNGKLVLRLPAGTYEVDMTMRTTYRLSAIDVSISKEVVLDDSQTLAFDLDDSQYPVPVYSTNLFLVLLAIILLVVVILLLVRSAVTGRGGDGGPSIDGGDDDVTVDLEDTKVSLTDQMEEGEIELEEEDD